MAKKAHATEEIPCSDQPAIRLFNPYYAGNDVGGNPFNFAEIARLAAKVFYRGAWAACTMETAACFSAIGYYFAKEVHTALGVPVGVIAVAVVVSPAEAQKRSESLDADAELRTLVASNWLTNPPFEAWCRQRAD